MSILPVIDFRPDLIHCHDWQTGLVPVYLHERFQGSDFYRGIKTAMTIHNLKFQGKWSIKEVQDITGLPMSFFTPDKLEAYKDANLLKGGIVYADAITTVSETYAEEIKMPFYGEGLDGLMRARANSLRGIVNGLEKHHVNRGLGTTIAYIIMALVLALIGFLLFSPMFGLNAQFNDLVSNLPHYVDAVIALSLIHI